MELELVSFEQAEALKKLGYPQDENCCGAHSAYSNHSTEPGKINYYLDFIVPSYELALKWLRKEKDFNIQILYSLFNRMVNNQPYTYHYAPPKTEMIATGEIFETPEEAMSAGINKAIKFFQNQETI